MSSAADSQKIAKDILALALAGISTAVSGDPATALAALPQIKDLAEQLILLLPPVDASSLDPADRAAIDAAAEAEIAKKFPVG